MGQLIKTVRMLFEVAGADHDGIIYTHEFTDNSDTFLAGRRAPHIPDCQWTGSALRERSIG
jgi:hypothetical protein